MNILETRKQRATTALKANNFDVTIDWDSAVYENQTQTVPHRVQQVQHGYKKSNTNFSKWSV